MLIIKIVAKPGTGREPHLLGKLGQEDGELEVSLSRTAGSLKCEGRGMMLGSGLLTEVCFLESALNLAAEYFLLYRAFLEYIID